MGNDERVGADTALRIGLVTEVVPRDRLWARAHEIAATIAAKPPSATQGTVKAIWESLDKPYRAALEQGLIYTRLGNPLGKAELAAAGRRQRSPNHGSGDDRSPACARRIAAVLDAGTRRARDRVRRANGSRGDRSARWPAGSQRWSTTADQVGILLRNRPAHVAAFLGVLLAGGTVVVINPSRGDDRTRADIAALDLPVIIGDARRSGDARRAGVRIDA